MKYFFHFIIIIIILLNKSRPKKQSKHLTIEITQVVGY